MRVLRHPPQRAVPARNAHPDNSCALTRTNKETSPPKGNSAPRARKESPQASALRLTAFVRRADEGTLSRLLVEASILIAASRGNPSAVLKEAASAYKVNTEAIATKVRQEFAAKEKARKSPQTTKATKKAA